MSEAKSTNCVHLVREDNGDLTSAVVCPDHGANVLGLAFKHEDWAWPIPILEPVDIASVFAKPTSYGMPLLAPTPGRVGVNQNGNVAYRGKTYQVSPSRHGVLRTLTWTIEEQQRDALRCVVTYSPEVDGWHFAFHLRADYTLKVVRGGLECRLTMTNIGDIIQPVAAGWHPYLSRNGKCRVRIPAKSRWELDHQREPTPTGRLIDVVGRADFRDGRDLDVNEQWDDVFTTLTHDNGLSQCWTEETRAVEGNSGTSVNVRIRRIVEFPHEVNKVGACPIKHVQLFTPRGRNAICIEPLSAPPNAINLHSQSGLHVGLCELMPGEQARFTMFVRAELEPN